MVVYGVSRSACADERLTEENLKEEPLEIGNVVDSPTTHYLEVDNWGTVQGLHLARDLVGNHFSNVH